MILGVGRERRDKMTVEKRTLKLTFVNIDAAFYVSRVFYESLSAEGMRPANVESFFSLNSENWSKYCYLGIEGVMRDLPEKDRLIEFTRNFLDVPRSSYEGSVLEAEVSDVVHTECEKIPLGKRLGR
jgi:hypothetical protein